VVRDASGHPTGVLLEAAMHWRAVRSMHASRSRISSPCCNASRYLNSFGHHERRQCHRRSGRDQTLRDARDRGMLTVRTRTAFGAVAALTT